MEKKYLFIIPLTPQTLLNEIRINLQFICFETLKSQSYHNWKALVIGDYIENVPKDNRFININYEGRKEEKLQKATQYIIDNDLKSDYIIRLDDDDIFNPNILNEIKDLDFDIYVDKTQFFWNHETKQVASRTWNWFPNTCIHKTKHALTEYGSFAKGDFQRFHDKSLLIENDHSQLHPYYINKKVIYSKKNSPVYLRSITNTSITAGNSKNYNNYLNRFGNWYKNNLFDFSFLGKTDKKIFQSLVQRLRNIKIEFRSRLDYLKQLNE